MTFDKTWTEEEISFEISNGFPIIERALLELDDKNIKDDTVSKYASLILKGLSLNEFHLKNVIRCLLGHIQLLVKIFNRKYSNIGK